MRNIFHWLSTKLDARAKKIDQMVYESERIQKNLGDLLISIDRNPNKVSNYFQEFAYQINLTSVVDEGNALYIPSVFVKNSIDLPIERIKNRINILILYYECKYFLDLIHFSVINILGPYLLLAFFMGPYMASITCLTIYMFFFVYALTIDKILIFALQEPKK